MLLYYLSLVSLLFLPINAFISINQMDNLSKQISEHFLEIFDSVTQTSKMEDEFNRLYEEKYFEIKEKNFSEISKNFSKSLHYLLESNKESLINIKDQIQRSQKDYQYNHSIERFSYANERDVLESDVKEEPTFASVKVNINKSHVQIPMNIYKYDTQILNDVKWTEDINTVFRSNFERTPSLLWQYFSTKTGVMRTYPGRRDTEEKNFYDARRRMWYTEAINSPKDAVIAVDLSGSLIGTPFKIASLTVKSLINTFQQNDFFNVIYSINQKVSYLEPCRKNLIQATNINKKLMNKNVDRLDSPLGEQNNTGLLEEAFLLFNRSLQSDMTSSGCTRTLMLISDGIESDTEYSKIIERYQKQLDVVIFTFFIGFGTCKEQMQTLSRDNGGDMYEFPTLGSVWNGVLEHQTVLSEPLASANYSNNITFTPLYLDFYEDNQIGLGMIISMAIGVFSRHEERELLGAAGIDIRMTQIEQRFPKHSLGVFGRAFAINNNGLFLIHPNFRDPTPFVFDLPTVYLEDIEYTVNKSNAEYLKIQMVERQTGCIQSQVNFLFPPMLHTRLKVLNTTYCYHPIDNTPFTSAVSIPEEHKYELIILNTGLEELGIKGLNISNNTINEIADWPFCNISAAEQENKPASKKYFPKSYELYNFLTNDYEKREKLMCDIDKLNKLLFTSAVISNHTANNWDTNMLKNLNVSSLYVYTETGYITKLNENLTEIQNRDIFSKQHYMHPLSNLNKENKYKITFTVPTKISEHKVDLNNIDWNEEISIARPIVITPKKLSIGVIGLNYSSKSINEFLQTISLHVTFDNETECNHSFCEFKDSGSLNESFSCADSNKFSCYLIDENAFVVSSNQNADDVGIFFGIISGMLMDEFLNLSLYSESKFNDTQALCIKFKNTITSSSGQILKNWLHNLVKSLIYLTSSFIKIVTFVCKFTFVTSNSDPKIDEPEKENASCTKTVTVYKQTIENIKQSGEILCQQGCIQKYFIKSIEHTNLNLIVIKKNCPLNCEYRLISNKPVETNASNLCNRKVLHRKKLAVCNRKTSQRSKSYASKTFHSKYILFIMIITQFIKTFPL